MSKLKIHVGQLFDQQTGKLNVAKHGNKLVQQWVPSGSSARRVFSILQCHWYIDELFPGRGRQYVENPLAATHGVHRPERAAQKSKIQKRVSQMGDMDVEAKSNTSRLRALWQHRQVVQGAQFAGALRGVRSARCPLQVGSSRTVQPANLLRLGAAARATFTDSGAAHSSLLS